MACAHSRLRAWVDAVTGRERTSFGEEEEEGMGTGVAEPAAARARRVTASATILTK